MIKDTDKEGRDKVDAHIRSLESRAVMEQARKVSWNGNGNGSAVVNVPAAIPQNDRKRRLPPRPPGWGSDEDASRTSLMAMQQLRGN